jgi:NADPH:quinone reductase
MFNHAVRPQRGQSVLIYAAAGGMGNALIDLAKMADLIVVGAVKSRFARDFGADHIIDRKVESASDKLPEVAASTSSSILSRDRPYPTTSACAPCGLLVLYGALGGKAQHDLQATLRLTKNSPAVRQFTIHTWDGLVEERRAGMRALTDMLAAGKLHPRIHGHLPLVEATRAHEMLESGLIIGKLLLRP